jgi:hypothetical protein
MVHFRVAPNRIIKNDNRTYVADSTGLLTDVVAEDHAMILALGGVALVEATRMPVGPGEAGQVMISQGPGFAPVWGWSGAIGAASATGGTGATGLTGAALDTTGVVEAAGTTARMVIQSGGVVHSEPGPGQPGYVDPNAVVGATGTVVNADGTTTVVGNTGNTGASGYVLNADGTTGYVVGAANTGATGVFGTTGSTGVTSANGVFGATSSTFGATGFTGTTLGNTGSFVGSDGSTVLAGNVGPVVSSSTTSPLSNVITTGTTSTTGPITFPAPVMVGDTGTSSFVGATGPTGATGATGDTGATSPVVFDPISGLPIGLTGNNGATGVTGS